MGTPRGTGKVMDRRKRMGFMRGCLCYLALLLVWSGLHAGTVTYVYTDPQGTPLAEADANSNITATYDYAPYGSIALGTAPNGPGYTGHVNDPDTGLVYMQARYYDPAVGRFLSIDPASLSAGNAFGFNRYAYANNNPVANIDKDGKQTVPLANELGTSDPTVINDYLRAENRNATIVVDKFNEAAEPLMFMQPELGALSEGLSGLSELLSFGRTAEVVGAGVKAGTEVPDAAIIARGGALANQTAAKIDIAIGPSRTPGVSGFSSQCGMCLSEAGAHIPNKQMGIATAGDFRAAGGDVIRTPGVGNHVTVTGVSGEKASSILQVVPNPNPKQM